MMATKLTPIQQRVIECLAGRGSVIWAFGHNGKFWASPHADDPQDQDLAGFYIHQRFIYPLNHMGLINISDPDFKRELSLTPAGLAYAHEKAK